LRISTPRDPEITVARSSDRNQYSGHLHAFDVRNPLAERRTRQVMWLTAAMMVIEIVAGTVFGSMALLADGWHMSSHALALGVSAGAYALARRHAEDPRFAFGTWKIEVLGGYTSAVFLLGVAGYMGFESLSRLVRPASIHFDEAIPVAVLGLVVNLVSAWMLASGARGHRHDHAAGHQRPSDEHVSAGGHDAGRAHSHGGAAAHAGHAEHTEHAGHASHATHAHHHDLNLRAAYLHVIADAATSVLAIFALIGGKYFGAGWLDPVMGIVGTVLVGRWAVGLLRDTGRVLLDAEMDSPVVNEVCEIVESLPQPAVLRDLHVWRVGMGKYACIVSIAATDEVTIDEIRRRLAVHEELVHVTVELTPHAP
jgi:cation diffusion facilitator family transporter